MNKDYQVKFTGTIIGGDTLVGHLLGHTLNARNFFGMTHGYFTSSQVGLDELFPDYIRKSAQAVDETFGPHQTYGYNKNVPTHEPIQFNDEDRGKYGPYWPNHETDYGSFDNNFKRVDTIDKDEENQIRIWTMNWDWMLRDSALTYLRKIAEIATDKAYSEKERDLRAAQMEYIVVRLYDLHAEFEREQVEHYRKQVEVKQWLLDWLWERGEVTINRVQPNKDCTMKQEGMIHAELDRYDKKSGRYFHAHGNTLPEAINKLWNVVYKDEERA